MRRSQPLDGLIKWARRDEWQEAFAEVTAEHLGELCEEAEITVDDLSEVIGEAAASAAWGSVFEDFISRDLDDAGRNVADDYLRRRGWKESAGTRDYIEALRYSEPGLYAVSDIIREEGLALRDLLRGGEPVRVKERAASRWLEEGDHIAARVVAVRGRPMLTSMVLRLEPDTSTELQEILSELIEQTRAELDAAIQGGQSPLNELDVDLETIDPVNVALAGAAPLITKYWLADLLGEVMDELPDLINAEGDPVMFMGASYPLAPGVDPAAARAALNAIPALDADQDDPNFWNWLADAAWVEAHPSVEEVAPPEGGEPAGEDAPPPIVTRLEDGTLVLGTVDLANGKVILVVNSLHRLERGRAMLEAALGSLVGEPVIEEQEPDGQMGMDDYFPIRGSVTPEEVEATHAALTAHYRQLIDRPIPVLGNVAPRRLVRTEEGRRKVGIWLDLLEQTHSGTSSTDANKGYDMGWLWDELGIAELRGRTERLK